MKKLITTLENTLHISPFLLLAGICFVLAIVFYPHAVSQVIKRTAATSIKGVTASKTVVQASPIPTNSNLQTPSVEVSPTTIPTQSIQTQTVQSQPTSTPAPTIQPTSAPQNTVNIQINEPDGTSNFSITLNSGNNLCDNLTEAKNEGKIKSLTLDYSYMSSYHSAYVREMNGYQNNWTVNVNGKTPQGCSLYNPQSGDNIVWKYN